MGRRKQRVFDAFERRDLMSITPIVNLLAAPAVSISAVSPSAVPPLTSFDGGSGITTDMSAPRPNEAARRAFKANFSGQVVELPPRLVDQSHQYYILAPGATNQFLHGTIQLRYYTPEPGSAVTTNIGTMSISDRSTASQAVILANLTGDPTLVDSRGRPTQFTFTLNGGGGSGGIYASSVGNGVVNIKYHGNKVNVSVLASIFITGVGQNLDVFQSNTHL